MPNVKITKLRTGRSPKERDTKMKTAILFLFCVLCCNPAMSNDRVTIRDKAGRIQSTVQSSGKGRLVVRNQRGQITGTITIKGGNAQYRNSKGQIGK
jgi:hypothetical protein